MGSQGAFWALGMEDKIPADGLKVDLVGDYKPNNYGFVDPAVVIDKCEHLDSTQKTDLKALLTKYPKLFDGVLRKYPGLKVHLEIDPTVPPRATRVTTNLEASSNKMADP